MEYLLGFLIAAAVGLTGVGGGTLTVPLLVLGLGIPAAEAVGTALIFVALTKLTATPVYLARGQVDARAALLLLAGGLPGVSLGSLLLNRMRVSALEPAVLTLVGATVLMMALATLWRHFRHRSAAGVACPSWLRGWRCPSAPRWASRRPARARSARWC